MSEVEVEEEKVIVSKSQLTKFIDSMKEAELDHKIRLETVDQQSNFLTLITNNLKKEVIKLRQENDKLKQENNKLKLKNEIDHTVDIDSIDSVDKLDTLYDSLKK